MADKLDWLNQHPLWFVYPTVSQVVEHNHLSLSTPLLALAQRFPIAEDYLNALWYEGKFKDACTFCAYNTNPRVAVWWAYYCVVDLTKELLLQPAQKIKIQDIAKPRPLTIPDWCNFPEEDKSLTPEQLSYVKKIKQTQAKLTEEMQNLQALMPSSLVNFINATFEATFLAMKERSGYDPRELLQEAFQKQQELSKMSDIDKDNSPIFKAAEELKQKIEKVRVETADLINSVLPEEDYEKERQVAAQCLDAVWAYISSPNDKNAQTVFQLGNACPNQVEGLLASVAFWSYGSLTPNQEQMVKTPAGLMANGINGLLVKCATTLGGVYKPVERFERYFNLAFAALTNQSNWEPFVERNTSPHQEIYKEILDCLNLPAPNNHTDSSQVSKSSEQTSPNAAFNTNQHASVDGNLPQDTARSFAQDSLKEINTVQEPSQEQRSSETFKDSYHAALSHQGQLDKTTVDQLKREADQKIQERLAKIRSDIQRRFKG